MNNSQNPAALGYREGSTAGVGDPMHDCVYCQRALAAERCNVSENGISCPFANHPPVQITATHARLCAEGNKMCADLGDLTTTQVILFLGENNNRSSFRCFIRQTR
jgi:hypothetical protein